jgi:8-oxo-dGTP pyrophosphatase MutT (NUDIX family)
VLLERDAVQAIDEVIDQLKFLLFKSPVTKSRSGLDWKSVKMGDVKTPISATPVQAGPSVVAPPGKPTKPGKGPAPMPGSGALAKSADAKWKKPEKWFSAGGVVVASKDDYTKVYIRKPSNNYGPWSFPKGRIDKGESPPKTALREVSEEIGVKAALVPGGYLGTGDGDFSVTHFYLMYCVRDTHRTDHETEEVKVVTWSEAIHTFASVGNLRDLRIATRAMDLVEKLRKQGKVP